MTRDQQSRADNTIQQQITWSLSPSVQVGQALVSATQRLREAGCGSPNLDAQVLLAYALDKDRTWLFAHHEHKLGVDAAEAYAELVARRANREPVAYLVGQREFYGKEFVVDRRVLIPRPETEMLVDMALHLLTGWKDQSVVVADVGTGSGAIAITLALHESKATVYGLDVSPDALDVAEINRERLAKESHLSFVQSDLLSALPEQADLIVANLPYITSGEYEGLAPDIRNFEPRLALEAGQEGLDIIQRLLDQLAQHLKPNGVVLLEIGPQQGEAIRQMANDLTPKPRYVGLRQDYSGLVRMVTLEY